MTTFYRDSGVYVGSAEFQVEDQITGCVWTWKGSKNFVRLEPDKEPAHVLVIRK